VVVWRVYATRRRGRHGEGYDGSVSVSHRCVRLNPRRMEQRWMDIYDVGYKKDGGSL